VLIAREPGSGGENVTIGRIRKKSSPTLHLDFDYTLLLEASASFGLLIFIFFYNLLHSTIVPGILNTETQHVVHAQRRPTAEPQRAWPGSRPREMGSSREAQG
jgi:hypothetical protein